MKLEKHVSDAIVTQIVKTPAGRAWLLQQIADAEDNGEAPFFDDARRIVTDPRYRRMIDRHQADEVRHGALFRACFHRQGAPVPPVPADVKVLEHVDRLTGGRMGRPLETEEDVLDAYLMLQAIEERAVAQFSVYAPIFAKFDPETAAVFREVTADEVRHLKYCQAITRHLEPDATRRQARLLELRQVEADAFRLAEEANVRHIQALRIIENPLVRAFFGAVVRRNLRGRPQPAAELLAA